MEDIEEKLDEDAEKLAAFGQEYEYVIDAVYNVLGKRIVNQGYVDGSFVLKATGRGQYSSQLKGSKFQELFSKNCMVSENIDIMLEYLENVICNPDSLSALEGEALVFWLFLPYLSLAKRSKRKPYMLSILKRILTVRTGEDIWERNLRISETVVFDSDVCCVEIVSSVEKYAKYTFELKYIERLNREAKHRIKAIGPSRMDRVRLCQCAQNPAMQPESSGEHAAI